MFRGTPALILLLFCQLGAFDLSYASETVIWSHIKLRAEIYSRPPYSSAFYRFYEQNGKVLCTEIEICDKFDNCKLSLLRGKYVMPEDQNQTPVETKVSNLLQEELPKQPCLRKFNLH